MYVILTFSHSSLHQLLLLVLPVERMRPDSPNSFISPVSVDRSHLS